MKRSYGYGQGMGFRRFGLPPGFGAGLRAGFGRQDVGQSRVRQRPTTGRGVRRNARQGAGGGDGIVRRGGGLRGGTDRRRGLVGGPGASGVRASSATEPGQDGLFRRSAVGGLGAGGVRPQGMVGAAGHPRVASPGPLPSPVGQRATEREAAGSGALACPPSWLRRPALGGGVVSVDASRRASRAKSLDSRSTSGAVAAAQRRGPGRRATPGRGDEGRRGGAKVDDPSRGGIGDGLGAPRRGRAFRPFSFRQAVS